MIKLFEEYSEYYTEVKLHPMYHSTHTIGTSDNKLIPIVDDESKIRDIISRVISDKFKITFGQYLIYVVSETRFSIRKLRDEWYIISFYNFNNGLLLTYKCDQLDGLETCLKEVLC